MSPIRNRSWVSVLVAVVSPLLLAGCGDNAPVETVKSGSEASADGAVHSATTQSLLGYKTTGAMAARLAELDERPHIARLLRMNRGESEEAVLRDAFSGGDLSTRVAQYLERAVQLDAFVGVFSRHVKDLVWDAEEGALLATLVYTEDQPLVLESAEWIAGEKNAFMYHGTLRVLLSFKTAQDWKRREPAGTEQLRTVTEQRIELTERDGKPLVIEPDTRILFSSARRFCSIDHKTTLALAIRLAEHEGSDITDLLRQQLDAFVETFGRHLKDLTWDGEEGALLATLVYTEDKPVIWEARTRFMYDGTLTVLISPEITPPDINRLDPAGRVELQTAIKQSVEFTNAKGEKRMIEPGTRVFFWGATTFGKRG